MVKFSFLLIFISTSLCFASDKTISVRDALNNRLSFDAPVTRIISLSPHITELLFLAGAGEKVIGTVEFSDYPDAAKKIPIIGNFNQFDLEKILALKPQLIVVWASGTPARTVSKLQSLGFSLFFSEPRRINQIFYETIQLAKLTDTLEEAKKNVKPYEELYERLLAGYANQKRIRVFYQLWDSPLKTVNKDHIIDEIIQLCGGENIFSDLSNLIPQLDKEVVINKNPFVIIRPDVKRNSTSWQQSWKNFPFLDVVKRNHFYSIPWDLISRQTPRILFAAEELCEYFQFVRQNANPH